jgi:adenosine deaminase
VKSAYDPAVMAVLRERDIVLEICPTSNLHTRVVRDVPELRSIFRRLLDHQVPFTLSTDGPEMLRSYLRDEVALLLRNEILTFDEVSRALETAHRASFVDRTPVIGRPVQTDQNGAAPGERASAAIALEVEV